MQADTLRIDDIRYNPELEGFEAALNIHGPDGAFTYPVQIRAPLHADYALVARSLTRKGLAMHQKQGSPLRLRRLANTQCRAVAA